MTNQSVHPVENGSIATGRLNDNEVVPADLPANVAKAMARLDRLPEQVAEIQRCVAAMQKTVSSVLTRWR